MCSTDLCLANTRWLELLVSGGLKVNVSYGA